MAARVRRGPASAEQRLRRLLVMLPWLMERRQVPVAEVARTFKMTPDEVATELELAAMCGLPPFVDEMIDVFIDDDLVFVGVPRLFTKPLRLTAPEGFALLSAGRAAMQLPGFDPESALGRGLEKLAAALDEPVDDRSLVVELESPPLVDELITLAERGAHVQLRYWTASRDEVTTRTITPRRVFHERGDWYLVADDHRVDESRTFRIDRIEALEATGDRDERPRSSDLSPPTSLGWANDPTLPRVTLWLAPAARWVVERYPADATAEQSDGALVATFPVLSDRWLDRVLLRAGGDARIVGDAAAGGGAAAVARDLLDRYDR